MPWYKLPHTEIVMWFQYEMDLEPAGTPPPPALPLATCGMLNVSEFGATGSGWHDDTTHIQAALDACASEGGTVVAPPGRFLISAPILVPSGVNLWGAGMDFSASLQGTTFLCGTADATIRFGELGIANGNTGGLSGNFNIDGDGAADVGLSIGLSVSRSYQSIQSHAAAVGVLVEQAQNNSFANIQADTSSVSGFILDKGCAANVFTKCNVSGYGAHGIHIRQTGDNEAGLPVVPSHNTFYGNIFEWGLVTADAVLYHGAGLSNAFVDSQFSPGNDCPNTPVVKMVYDEGVEQCVNLRLVRGIVNGDSNVVPLVDGIDVGPNCMMQLAGVNIHNCRYAFIPGAGSVIESDSPLYSGHYELAADLSAANAAITKTMYLTGGANVLGCVGTPEGAVVANPGSLCLRSDGGAGTSLYVKQSGAGNTGWVGK